MSGMLRAASLAAVFGVAVFIAVAARGQDRVTFGLDWKAEAEYGGYYEALATGLYAERGLDVTIQEGGPQVNHMMLLMAGRLDFNGWRSRYRICPGEFTVSRDRSDFPKRPCGTDRPSWSGE